MIFSQDQVRHFYVATAYKEGPLTKEDAAGTIAVRTSTEDLWFEYVTPNWNNSNNAVVRSDLVPLKNITGYAVGQASNESRKLRRVEVKLTSNGGSPVPGQDYILRIVFYGLGIGGVENQYIKEAGIYRAKTGDSTKDVLEALIASAKTNFSREPEEYVTLTLSSGEDSIIIEEVEQPWVLGKKPDTELYFNAYTVPIKVDGLDTPWGEVEDTTSTNTNVVPNGKKMAEMEWFFHGERGDQFKGYGYPNNFDTKYLADPTKEYESINLDFYYAGDAEDVQKSKKTMTIVTSVNMVLEALEEAIDEALGN